MKCQRCGVKDYEPSVEPHYCQPCLDAVNDVRAMVRRANPWSYS